MLLHCVWVMFTYALHLGLEKAIEPAGIFLIQTAGSYFLARVYIRSANDLYRVVRLLVLILLFFIPFSMIDPQPAKTYS